MFYFSIFSYDLSKFEFECPFSDCVIFWTFEFFAIMHETNLSRPNDTGKFSEFFLRVRGDPIDEIDHKRKICSTIRFFDMISQSVNLSLFATYKLIKRPLPSKQHGEIC